MKTAKDNAIRPAGPGDLVRTAGRRVGVSGRMGEIVAVLGEDDRVHYLVRWEDGRESTLYPGAGTSIEADEYASASAD